jgi:hypothetical protein
MAELQALIVTLQTQVSALAAAAPAPAATTAVVFADTPQSLNSDDLIDYSTKKGESIYKEREARHSRTKLSPRVSG